MPLRTVACDACWQEAVDEQPAPLRGERRAWILPAPEGAYRDLPTWGSRALWLAAVAACLDSDQGREALRMRHVSAEAVRAVARADAEVADGRTGRNVATAHKTTARATTKSVATVRRARDWLADVGLAVTIVAGRYLRGVERAEAALAHGGRQVRAASTRALTLPRELAHEAYALVGRLRSRLTRDHLPRRGQIDPSNSPTRRVTNARAARARGQRQGRGVASPLALPVQRLAAEVDRVLPALVRGQHIGALGRTLLASGIDATRWTGRGLVDALDAANREAGLYALPWDSQRSRLALFAHQLRRLAGAEASRDRARRVAAEAERNRAEGRARLAAQRDAEAAAAEPATVARIAGSARAMLRASRAAHSLSHGVA